MYEPAVQMGDVTPTHPIIPSVFRSIKLCSTPVSFCIILHIHTQVYVCVLMQLQVSGAYIVWIHEAAHFSLRKGKPGCLLCCVV